MSREDELLGRLTHSVMRRLRPVTGCYHPDDQALLRKLEAAGKVETWPGEGRDRGMLLARLRAAPREHAAGSDGGAA